MDCMLSWPDHVMRDQHYTTQLDGLCSVLLNTTKVFQVGDELKNRMESMQNEIILRTEKLNNGFDSSAESEREVGDVPGDIPGDVSGDISYEVNGEVDRVPYEMNGVPGEVDGVPFGDIPSGENGVPFGNMNNDAFNMENTVIYHGKSNIPTSKFQNMSTKKKKTHKNSKKPPYLTPGAPAFIPSGNSNIPNGYYNSNPNGENVPPNEENVIPSGENVPPNGENNDIRDSTPEVKKSSCCCCCCSFLLFVLSLLLLIVAFIPLSSTICTKKEVYISAIHNDNLTKVLNLYCNYYDHSVSFLEEYEV